jgi:hypothetical protein
MIWISWEMPMEPSAFDTEVDYNFDAFEQKLGSILPAHRGEFALLNRGNIISYFPDEASALTAGRLKFPDGLFSVQEVTDRPVDLGFFSHAINSRIA